VEIYGFRKLAGFNSFTQTPKKWMGEGRKVPDSKKSIARFFLQPLCNLLTQYRLGQPLAPPAHRHHLSIAAARRIGEEGGGLTGVHGKMRRTRCVNSDALA
jgi:hypothetical protein